jgi:secondary thiamine-phosphate synthase enzyme
MRIWNEYLTLTTKEKVELLNIQQQVAAAVSKSGIVDGLVVVSTLHANSGIYVNLEDPEFLKDALAWLEQLAPKRDGYHLKKHESNAGTYLKNLLLGHQAILSLEAGKLAMGPWQAVYYAEFDGQRPKRILVKILGE